MAAVQRARGTPASLRAWLIRAAVVATAGLAIGAAGGVISVRTLEPGRPARTDSLQLMLDSIANGTAQKTPAMVADDARASRRSVDSAEASNRAQVSADSTTTARTVPDVIGLEEGTARPRITEAGLTVGEVLFEDSDKPTGSVLRSVPAAGAVSVSGAPVALFLSNGRPPQDALLPTDPGSDGVWLRAAHLPSPIVSHRSSPLPSQP